MTQQPQRRLKKHMRDPDGFGPLRVQERDVEILRVAHRLRYCTADLIQALVPGSGRQIARRLQGLFHHGHLVRYLPYQRLRTQLDLKGSEKMIYGLDLEGWKLLEKEVWALGQEQFDGLDPEAQVEVLARFRGRYGRGSEAEEQEQEAAIKLLAGWWHKDYTRRAEFHILHQVEVARFHAALEVAVARHPGVRLVEWRQGNQLEDQVRVLVRDERGEREERQGLKPDGYFALEEHGRRRNFFVEIDRGTEEHTKLRRKFQGYYNYVRSGRYKRRYAGRTPEDVRILVVTTPAVRTRLGHEREARSRLDRMLETLTKIRAKRTELGQFWFSTLDAYGIQGPDKSAGRGTWEAYGILDAIWSRVPLEGKRQGKVPLLTAVR